jgi:hypothetical protein
MRDQLLNLRCGFNLQCSTNSRWRHPAVSPNAIPQEDNASRFVRGKKAIRHGDDFVRATFEWISDPD